VQNIPPGCGQASPNKKSAFVSPENVFLPNAENLRFSSIKIGKYDENKKYINVQKELNTNL